MAHGHAPHRCHATLQRRRGLLGGPAAPFGMCNGAVWTEISISEGWYCSAGPTREGRCMVLSILQHQRTFKGDSAAPFGVPNGCVYVENGVVKVGAWYPGTGASATGFFRMRPQIIPRIFQHCFRQFKDPFDTPTSASPTTRLSLPTIEYTHLAASSPRAPHARFAAAHPLLSPRVQLNFTSVRAPASFRPAG